MTALEKCIEKMVALGVLNGIRFEIHSGQGQIYWTDFTFNCCDEHECDSPHHIVDNERALRLTTETADDYGIAIAIYRDYRIGTITDKLLLEWGFHDFHFFSQKTSKK